MTEINFNLPRECKATLKVYNVRGQLVTTLVSGVLPAGHHSVTWSTDKNPNGVSFYRLVAPGFTETKKMIILK